MHFVVSKLLIFIASDFQFVFSALTEGTADYSERGICRAIQAGVRQGVAYYAENFFLADGRPKYYHDRVYPIDIHAPAEAITFFSEMGHSYRALTDNLVT